MNVFYQQQESCGDSKNIGMAFKWSAASEDLHFLQGHI